MTQDSAECVFCKIAARQMGAHVIAETDLAMAMLDAFPLARGHSLVIPKAHSQYVQDMTEPECAQVFELARQLAARVGKVHGDSLVAVHNGRQAGQEIPHVHVHIIPRSPTDGAAGVHSMFGASPERAPDEELAAELEKLRA